MFLNTGLSNHMSHLKLKHLTKQSCLASSRFITHALRPFHFLFFSMLKLLEISLISTCVYHSHKTLKASLCFCSQGWMSPIQWMRISMGTCPVFCSSYGGPKLMNKWRECGIILLSLREKLLVLLVLQMAQSNGWHDQHYCWFLSPNVQHLSYSKSIYYTHCMLGNYINPLTKQNYLSVFQLQVTGAASVSDFNGWGNSEPVCAINYLQFDPPFEGQTT